MVGPKFVLRQNPVVTSFAQVLFVGSALATLLGEYVRDFASQFGGGLDVTIKRSFDIRLEADYRLISTGDPHVKEFRPATGAFISR